MLNVHIVQRSKVKVRNVINSLQNFVSLNNYDDLDKALNVESSIVEVEETPKSLDVAPPKSSSKPEKTIFNKRHLEHLRLELVKRVRGVRVENERLGSQQHPAWNLFLHYYRQISAQ